MFEDRKELQRMTSGLGLVLCLAFAGTAQAVHYDVILLGGQSNMSGRANDSGLSATLANPQSDVAFYYNDGKSVSNEALRNTLTTLRPGSGTDFGPELSFGRTIADARPTTDFALIKYAFGGTDLNNDWDPTTGSTYTAFKNTVTAGLSALTTAGHTYEITGMLWTQGESDDGRTTLQYETDLNELITDVRSEYGSDLPFFISRLSDNQTGVSGRAAIQAAQDNVAANDALSYVVNTDSLTMKDSLHFDTAGQVALGEGFAASYLANVPEPGSLLIFGVGGLLVACRRRR